MKQKDNLEVLLSLAKDSYSSDKSQFARRLEWIIILSEENYQEELKRRELINGLVSSLLIASSFLIAGFITFICHIKYSNTISLANNSCGTAFVIVAGIMATISTLLQLFLILYKKRCMVQPVSEIAKNYLDKEAVFSDSYSENYGRILTLDKMINSLIRKNNISSNIEKTAVISLAIFLIAFVVCFFVI